MRESGQLSGNSCKDHKEQATKPKRNRGKARIKVCLNSWEMYVTRPLSLYRKSPDALSLPLPEGPRFGILVIQDEEAEPTSCFGLFRSNDIMDLPFPQNKSLEHRYITGIGVAFNTVHHFQNVIFIPVLNQPLSSNLYYAIQPHGKDKGYALLIINNTYVIVLLLISRFSNRLVLTAEYLFCKGKI